jgi:hypothetical protein
MGGEPPLESPRRRAADQQSGAVPGLAKRAHAEGALRELPPVQRLAFLLGALVMPMVFAAGWPTRRGRAGGPR